MVERLSPDFLLTQCVKETLTAEIIAQCEPFTCGKDEADMDEFFREDAIEYTRFKMGKSYCFRSTDDPRHILACLTVSNDSLRIYDLPSSRRNAMWGITNREKMLSRYPGVLIGRLAVAEHMKGRGLGTQILRFLKMWFDDPDNKTACRFLIVDAKNDAEVLAFYRKNGFEFLFTSELQEDLYSRPPRDKADETDRRQNPRRLRTRLMFYDLTKNALEE